MAPGNSSQWLHLFPFRFYTMVLMLDSFILKWQATSTADLNLWYISSSSTFSYNFTSFLHFLGALPASLEALHMGLLVLFKVYSVVLKMIKNTQEPLEITFYCDTNLLVRPTAHVEMISITQRFKQIAATVELIVIATGGAYEIMTAVQ
uniref:Uncharacterized protein n=1 Tax=Monodon monoceros TaxID=40151 RepID=A0A8C6BMU8_MONMO